MLRIHIGRSDSCLNSSHECQRINFIVHGSYEESIGMADEEISLFPHKQSEGAAQSSNLMIERHLLDFKYIF